MGNHDRNPALPRRRGARLRRPVGGVHHRPRALRPEDRVVTIAQTREPVRCAKGLRVIPDHGFDDAPKLDVVLVPGGQGTRREVANPVADRVAAQDRRAVHTG